MDRDVIKEIMSASDRCRSDNINFYTMVVLLILFSNTVAYTIVVILEVRFEIVYTIYREIMHNYCCRKRSKTASEEYESVEYRDEDNIESGRKKFKCCIN
jgi:hypothetical protein